MWYIAQCVKPLRIWEIKKWVPWPPFSVVEIISDRNIWVNIFCQFHFLSNIWYELKPHLSRTRISLNFDSLAEGCDKVRGPVEQTLGKTAANIFEYPGERKIFGKYLHREGLDGQNFYFLVFFSARPDCSLHQILDLSDQPFMFFANMSTNIWPILYKNIFGTKLWRFLTSQKWNF